MDTEHLVKYFRAMYSEAEVRFKGDFELIRQEGGIRQGCQMSGLIFNGGMDMAYEKIDPQLGYRITEEVTLTNLLFADDGNLPSEAKEGSQQNTAILVEELSSYGMNTKKCATLFIIPNKRLKTTYVDSTSYLMIDGQDVPALDLNDT